MSLLSAGEECCPALAQESRFTGGCWKIHEKKPEEIEWIQKE